MQAPSLRAELRQSGVIWTTLQGAPRPFTPDEWLLTDAAGVPIAIREVLPHNAHELLLIPAEIIDIRRVYRVEIPELKLACWCSFDGWFRDLYSHKALGANVLDDGSATEFRVFSPRANAIRLYLYDDPDTAAARSVHEMKMDDKGVWECSLPGDLHGTYYDFTVHGPDEPGNHFYETTAVHISDPYARVNMDAWGRSRVWRKLTPATPLKKRPPMEDVIAYEVHIQDFTDLLPVDDSSKGCFPAFHRRGLRNSRGEAIGFDYLLNLGVNVIHLMPVQEYMHYPDSEWRASFAEDPFMIEQGIAEENYDWGYRTSHAFAIENKYRSKGTEPGAERGQFRDLVQACHDAGIAVIVDIVPNHSAEDMDQEPHFFHWNVLDKLYHYRTREFKHIGEYGNEVKFENRPMNQRWLIDQCKQMMEEFGVDGFRIDLAGLVDRQTLLKLRHALGPDAIIYGEPWTDSNDPDFENNPDWDWYKHNAPITFFQDESRNAFKGPAHTPREKGRDQGYAGGNFHEKENVKKALSARFPHDYSPVSRINYLDIHDNWALADQFALHDWDGRFGVDEARYKIAALLLYTSTGPIVTHGGTEMMRSKGLAALHETVKTTISGIRVPMHGKRDTYNMRAANRFLWDNAGATPDKDGVPCDYAGMYSFWRGLNKFRLSKYGKVFRKAHRMPDNYYRWVETVNPYQLGYFVDEKVFVLINTGGMPHDFPKVWIPEGEWKLIGNLQGVDHRHGVQDEPVFQHLQGNKAMTFWLSGPSFKLWVRL